MWKVYFIGFISICFGGGVSAQTLIEREQKPEGKQESPGRITTQDIDMVTDSIYFGLPAIPERIYQTNTYLWYADQYSYWAGFTQGAPYDAEGWFNFFKAALYAEKSQSTRDSIIHSMEKFVPGTFQLYYSQYLNSGRKISEGDKLLRAFTINPDRVEIYKEMARYFEIKGEKNNQRLLMKDWATRKEIPEDLMLYGENLLKTPAAAAILVTDGEYDTYPLWMLQYNHNLRPDVSVLNLSLAEEPEYWERIRKETGLVCSVSPENTAEFLKQLVEENPSKVFYISMTVAPAKNAIEESNLYNEGLAWRYTTSTAYDNSMNLRNNWEANYATGYLQRAQVGNTKITTGRLDALNLNYVYSGLELYDYYVATGDEVRSREIAELLKQIADRLGKAGLIEEYIEE